MDEPTKSQARTVENNMLVSTGLPPIKVQVDGRMEYVGRLDITLYGIAQAEIFVFAEAGEGRKLKRWVIVQFEGYLSNNTHTYNYAMPGKVRLGEHEYMYDDYVADLADADEKPGSDASEVRNLLRNKGFVLPKATIRTRYVRILGEDRRRELLLIYAEDLAPLGFAVSDLTPDGWLSPEHTDVAEGLHARSQQAFSVIEG